MASQEYELAFYGELMPGADLNDCKSKLAQLFKASTAQIEKMFSGQRVVLKSKLDIDTAEKYLGALKARGALCKLELVQTQAPLGEVVKESGSGLQQDSTSPPDGQPQQTEAPRPSVSQSFGSTDDSSERLNVAGEKVDEVLANVDFSVEPLGVDLADKKEDVALPELTMQDSLSVAPAGSDLGQSKDEKPPVSPDISYLSLKD